MRALAAPPESRGLGLGRRLAEACLTRARDDGATVFGLHTADEMPAARKIYAGLGFRVTAEAPAYFGLRYRVYRLDLRSARLSSPSIRRSSRPQEASTISA